ncbi:MAG: Ldh family oxidoreductase [Burkholderiales bacterium]
MTALAVAALCNAGASQAMADSTARCLVAADAQGLPTHGVARIPNYCDHLKSGRVHGRAIPSVVREQGATVLVDAADGLSFPAIDLAIAEAVQRARVHGVSFAGILNSHHSGALGILLEPVAVAGLVGLAFSNAAACIVPAGGAHPVFGTNPVAAIFPRRNGDPLVVDLSLTQVTRGEIMLRQKRGEAIPEGWGCDAEGNPTTDAAKILLGGSLAATGGVKGTMLALAVELLCCAVAGGTLSHQITGLTAKEGPPIRSGQAFLVIDPGALAGSDSYLERVETLVNEMLKDEGVRLPGARRRQAADAAARAGLNIDAGLLVELQALAVQCV